MKPKSDNLFHFTRSLDILKLILEKGFQPRYCLEDVRWHNGPWAHVAYAMSCFCDIPLSRIGEHTAFYGSYGLGLTKDWGMRNGLEPVVYIRPGGAISKAVDYMMRAPDAKGDDEQTKQRNATLALLRFTKPISGQMLMAGSPVDKDFFQENEWRYAPNIDNLLTADEFDAEKDKANEQALAHTLAFSPQDIKYIFVQRDSEIPELVDFINQAMGRFPHNDLKILQSRITSLETISADI